MTSTKIHDQPEAFMIPSSNTAQNSCNQETAIVNNTRRDLQSRSQPTRVSHNPSNFSSGFYSNSNAGVFIDVQEILETILNYRPVSQLVSLQILRKSGTTITKKYKQAVFYGECNGADGKKSGSGIMLYTNGRVYEGQWSENLKDGKGYEKFQNGSVYQGGYSKGKPQGFGRYKWPNGQVYEGQWKDGLKNGSGIWRGSKGDSYIGEWKDGKADGDGVHTWINGDRYEGEFQNCMKHGQGIQKFTNGDIYKGNYQNGKPCGNGEYYWSSGSFFKGNFKNGLRDGYGVWKRCPGNSDKYEGQYRDDQKEGYGVFSWTNGNIYKGNYSNDMREGYGEMYWMDGSCYKGMWMQGAQQTPNQNTNDLVIKVTSNSKTGRSQPVNVNNVPFGNQEDFFEFQERPNNYNQPETPVILEKSNRRPFRARGVTSQKSSRDRSVRAQKSVRAESPQSRIYLNSSFQHQPRLNKKYSAGTKFDMNTKKRSHPKFSSSHAGDFPSNNHHNNHHNHQMMSASFFLYKIHKDGKSQQSHQYMHSNSNSFMNSTARESSSNRNGGIYEARQIKTSVGFRQKKIADQIKYFTKAKMSDPQFL